MPAIYETPAEQALHSSAIDALAGEMRVGAHEVRSVYEDCYLRLRSSARIRDYLALLVARHTREALRHRSL
jgi:hypothetical protein